MLTIVNVMENITSRIAGRSLQTVSQQSQPLLDSPIRPTISFGKRSRGSTSDQSAATVSSRVVASIAGDTRTEKASETHRIVQRKRPWELNWLLELSAVLFSMSCLIVMLAILIGVNGKPLASWKIVNVQLTPNTLVSIFSTLAKSSILLLIAEGISQLKWTFFEQCAHRVFDLQIFDDASRGPLGALQFLCRMRFKAVIASFGALLTILALAVDPFTQQILSYPAITVDATNLTASIGAAKRYTDESAPDENGSK